MSATLAAPARTQARAVLGLRWQMIRTPGVKLGICLTLLVLLWVVVLAASSASALEPAALETAKELAPQAFLGFGVLAIIAPLTTGGGTQVIPADHLVAFPVRPGTHFLGGLALAPANLVWFTQLIVLAAETAYLSDGAPLAGLVTAAAYIIAITVFGQTFAWGLSGVRQSRLGRHVVLVLAVGLVLATVAVVQLGHGRAALDRSPTHAVVDGIAAGGDGDWLRWSLTTAALLALVAAALALGPRAVGWALRRPSDAVQRGESLGVRRRRQHRSALRELVAVDRASVWRASALRRGGLVMALVPGVVAACAQVPWESLVVLPGLVAAGAGLLFGVNAFALDGPGAVWLASLPHDPQLVLRAKAIVLTETVLGAALLAALAGSVRSSGSPTLPVAIGIVTGTLVCVAYVVACSLSMSVRHPHQAELRGPRDSIAPPGALVTASVRLAVPTALTAVLLESAARTGRWWAPLLVAVPLAVSATRHARKAATGWADPLQRSRVVQVVSAG